jgi:hypothetical protein
MPDDNFFNSRSMGSSQFWQGLHKIKHLFKWGAIHRVKNGRNTSFWEDVWCGDVPLKVQYPDLLGGTEWPLSILSLRILYRFYTPVSPFCRDGACCWNQLIRTRWWRSWGSFRHGRDYQDLEKIAYQTLRGCNLNLVFLCLCYAFCKTGIPSASFVSNLVAFF